MNISVKKYCMLVGVCALTMGLQLAYAKTENVYSFVESDQTWDDLVWRNPDPGRTIIPYSAMGEKELYAKVGQMIELCPEDDYYRRNDTKKFPWGISRMSAEFFEFKGMMTRQLASATENCSGDRVFKFQAMKPGSTSIEFYSACNCEKRKCSYVRSMKYEITIEPAGNANKENL